MKRLSLHLMIALLTFVAGVAVYFILKPRVVVRERTVIIKTDIVPLRHR
jgi:hypothetical protein